MNRTIKISVAQQILNYEFQNEDLLWEALQAPGSNVTMLSGRVLTQGNKCLAALGDAVATLIVKLDCYLLHQSIGDTAATLQRTVNNSRFASLCDKTGLTACVNSNPSQGGSVSPRTRADTLEAIIGAVYQDGGIDSARSVMQSLQVIENDEYW
ncbi:ribonuclease III domain-containing protein [Xylaria sp. FL0043]|nr:ribonuclease III domain-containing protein [Xylaria sp. FL0043]